METGRLSHSARTSVKQVAGRQTRGRTARSSASIGSLSPVPARRRTSARSTINPGNSPAISAGMKRTAGSWGPRPPLGEVRAVVTDDEQDSARGKRGGGRGVPGIPAAALLGAFGLVHPAPTPRGRVCSSPSRSRIRAAAHAVAWPEYVSLCRVLSAGAGGWAIGRAAGPAKLGGVRSAGAWSARRQTFGGRLAATWRLHSEVRSSPVTVLPRQPQTHVTVWARCLYSAMTCLGAWSIAGGRLMGGAIDYAA